jgi:hypothetical protein
VVAIIVEAWLTCLLPRALERAVLLTLPSLLVVLFRFAAARSKSTSVAASGLAKGTPERRRDDGDGERKTDRSAKKEKEKEEGEGGEGDATEATMAMALAAVELAGTLTDGGLEQLKGLTSGGSEHMMDPRLVNCQRLRFGIVPCANVFATARAVAKIGDRLSDACKQEALSSSSRSVRAWRRRGLLCRVLTHAHRVPASVLWLWPVVVGVDGWVVVRAFLCGVAVCVLSMLLLRLSLFLSPLVIVVVLVSLLRLRCAPDIVCCCIIRGTLPRPLHATATASAHSPSATALMPSLASA